MIIILGKPSDVLATEWWIKINKVIGYDKISFCNQSIKHNVGFGELFNKYYDYLDISTLTCIPNLTQNSNKPKYFKYFNELIDDKGDFDVYKVEVINQLIINECYLDNIDKYKYITVIDNDETIIPKLTKFIDLNEVMGFLNEIRNKQDINILKIDLIDEIKCNRYENSSSMNNSLENYLKEINTKMNNGKTKTYYFGQGFFFKNNFAIQLMKALEEFFNESNNTKSNQINVIDNLPYVKNEHIPFNYTFLIRDKSETDYAKSLLVLNKYIIQPYYEKYKNLIKKHTYNFDRFFMITGDINNFSWGKSIHDSSMYYQFLNYFKSDIFIIILIGLTFDFTIHHATRYFIKLSMIFYFNLITNSLRYIHEEKPEIYFDHNFLHQSNAVYGSIP